MKLLFQEQTVELNNDSTIEHVIQHINELLGKEYYFSHLIANGQEITEAPEEYLYQNLTSITELEVVAIEAKKFINDLLLSSEEYIERAMPHITDLFEAFYHNPNRDHWISLSELFEGIQWLASMITTVDHSIVKPQNWTAVFEPAMEMQEELGGLEEALENMDTVLVADILQYEVLPVFEVLAVEIKKANDTEGMRYDLN